MARLQLRVQRYHTNNTMSNIRHALVALLFLSYACYYVVSDKFCAEDEYDDTCWQPCVQDSDCCSTSHRCLEAHSSCGSADLSGTNHYFCGVTWCDAAYKCGTPCPEQVECPEGEQCYGDIPCDSDSPVSAPPLPSPPTSSPYQFCGSSLESAAENCWQPCPRGNSDCCNGLSCFDTSSPESPSTCSNSDYSGSGHYFCGTSWCNAAYSCSTACPEGTNDECPDGQYCYGDIPCENEGQTVPVQEAAPPPNIFSMYCGTSHQDASNTCWQPCRNDDDCCFDQTCHANVTSCSYPDNIGADHYFCGSDFCEASYNCNQPCPSGYDAQCPNGTRCIPHSPCNANIGATTARDFLRYGLPRSMNFLMKTYTPDEIGQPETAATEPEPAGSKNSLLVGLLFGFCLAIVVAVNVLPMLMSKKYRQ